MTDTEEDHAQAATQANSQTDSQVANQVDSQVANQVDRPRPFDAAAGSESGVVMALELPTATLVWGGVGWLVDTYVFHTSPWVMISGFVLGFVLGMYLLYLRMQEGARLEEQRRARR